MADQSRKPNVKGALGRDGGMGVVGTGLASRAATVAGEGGPDGAVHVVVVEHLDVERGEECLFDPVGRYGSDVNLKTIAGWAAAAIAMWFVINCFIGTAHIVHNIGSFLPTVASGFLTSCVDLVR